MPAPDYFASLRLALPFLDGSRKVLAGAVALATLSVFLQLVPVWTVYRIIDAAVAGGLVWRFAVENAVLAFGAILLGSLMMGLTLGLSHVVAFDTIHRLRHAMARHMARLPLGYFSDWPSGDAKKLVIDEPEKLEGIIAHGLPEGVSSLAAWLAVSVWLLVLDWRLALAAIFVTPVSFWLLGAAMRSGARNAPAYQAAASRMSAAIVEFLAGMAVVKVFNRSDESLAEASAAVRDYVVLETRWARDYLPLGGTFASLVLTNIVFILPFGLVLLHLGEITLATLLLFIILGASYSQPLLKLFDQFHNLAHVSMGSSLVAALLAAKPQHDNREKLELASHDIRFEKVCFGYGGEPVLRDVGFRARAGTVTAIVGLSGAGKSTIASLIPRFWDVQSGGIAIGGVDVRDIGLDQLMDTVAFVFQSTFLFSDTIAANIRFGKPDATDEEVEAAARSAQAHDFISGLPESYATCIGGAGVALSGGERQRIAIARAILKDAPIIVLDEATAFADPDNEAAIQQALSVLSAGRTLIVVAHRLHTIAGADQILVVDAGRIVERGRHEDLVAGGGLYSRLWDDYTRGQAGLQPQRIR
ncbi:iron import ATP-binding/permease protein IrtA [Shinella sp. DD12]|nr:iron import ATP-binding/permease protein IrtA [Shinella sp. DD12]